MSTKLMQVLNNQISDINERKNFTTVASAIAVAYTLKMVTDPVALPNPYTYFDEVNEEDAKKLLMGINETFIISVRDALELARKLWVQRYNLIYNASAVNPALLVSMLSEEDEPSVGNEFAKFSKTYQVSSPVIMNELMSFIKDVASEYNVLQESNPSDELVEVSTEGFKEFFGKIKSKFTKKGLSSGEVKKLYNIFSSLVPEGSDRVLISFKEKDQVTFMVKKEDSDSLKNFTTMGKLYTEKKAEYTEAVKSANEFARPIMEKLKLKTMGFGYNVEKGKVKSFESDYEAAE